MDIRKITQANKASWDASAPHHKDSDSWKILVKQVSKPGFSTFDATMTDLLGNLDLSGKSVVQVGCNNGREVLSLAAFGAESCLGIDQSQAFLAQARDLAKIAGSDAQFVAADIYDLPEGLPRFDVALITIGVLNWMPDLPAFFRAVAGLLRPGGTLLIYETHPFMEMFDPESDTPFVPVESYFRKAPFVEDSVISYDGKTGETGAAFYWFIHTLADIFTACLAAGLTIADFREYPHSNREVAYDIYQDHAPQIPMCFSLIARAVSG